MCVCVCVCVCVYVEWGGGGGGEGLKCHLPKNSPGALRVQAFIAVIMFTLVTIYIEIPSELSQLQQMTV